MSGKSPVIHLRTGASVGLTYHLGWVGFDFLIFLGLGCVGSDNFVAEIESQITSVKSVNRFQQAVATYENFTYFLCSTEAEYNNNKKKKKKKKKKNNNNKKTTKQQH